MPKQMRMPAQAETIKRSLPADVAASVIFVEPVAFRSGEFAFFVITQSEILKCDLSANISSRYPFTKVASIDRSSEADTHKLFDSAEYQADVAKYSIRVTAQEASVPEVTDFYSYCHDSQLYFHMRQAWWHARLSAAIGDPLFPKASNMDALAGLRPDQIKTMFLELEHALLSSDDVRSQMSIVEEMTICAANNRTFKSFVLSSSNLALFWKRSISSIEQREKLTIDEISLCSVLYALIAYALAGSEQLILERSNFASKAQIETLFEIGFAAPPASAFPDRSDFIGSSEKDEAGTATELAAFEKRVNDLALEFDLHQSFFIFQLIAVLEQQWLGSHSNPERDRIFGFDSCFQQFVLKRTDYSFAKARAPHLFTSLIELMKLIEASRPIPDEEQHAADEEATLRLAGVEDEKIKENVRRVRRMERDKLRAVQVSPTLLPKLGAYFFQIVTVLQRLTGFAHVREMIYRSNSVDIRHYLTHRADDPLLERLDHIEDQFFHSAAETLIQIVDDMVKAT